MLRGDEVDRACFAPRGMMRGTVAFYLPSLAFLLISLSPFLLIEFAHHDDWNLFDPNFRAGQWIYELAGGRPFFVIFLKLAVFPGVHAIGDLLYCRIAAIAIFALLLSLFAAHLRRYDFSVVTAFCASALIFSLPGVQQRVSHVIALPSVIGILLAVLAGIMATEIRSEARSWRDYRIKDFWRLSAIVVALAVSFLTYQNCPMFFLLPVFADALFGRDATFKTRIGRAFRRSLMLILGLALCFLMYRFAVLPAVAKWLPAVLRPFGPDHQLEFSREIPHRLWRALTEWFPLESRLWFLEWPGASLIVLGIIVLGTVGRSLALRLRKVPPGEDIEAPLWALACALLLVAIANSPSIASDVTGALARLMFPASALLVILLLWIVTQILPRRQLGPLLIALTATAGAAAHIRVLYTAENSSIEYMIMREAVGRLAQVKGPIKELLIIKPPYGRPYVGPPTFADEFDFVSSYISGNAVSMYLQATADRSAPPQVRDLREEARIELDPAYFDDLHCQKEIFYLSEEGIVADMAAPLHLPQNRETCVSDIARYTVTPVSDGRNTPTRALANRGASNDFWETSPYPVTLTISYSVPETVAAYSLETAEDAERMPAAWQLEASNDQLTWARLDEQSNVVQWPLQKPVSFPIAHPGAYQFYRLVFTQGASSVLRIYRLSLDVAHPAAR